MNDIVDHAGRELVNIDKIKITLSVNRPARNR